MNGFFIAAIVEGHGEVSALPILLRRIHGMSEGADRELVVNSPIRIKAGSFLNDSAYRERYLQMASAKARHSGRKGLILVMLDCDDGCPATCGPDLRKHVAGQCGNLDVIVLFACREFETWFIASAPSLTGTRGFPENVEVPPDPEKWRDAKGWLGSHLKRRYNEPSDQPAFTSVFDFDLAMSNDSFARTCKKLKAFFAQSPS